MFCPHISTFCSCGVISQIHEGAQRSLCVCAKFNHSFNASRVVLRGHSQTDSVGGKFLKRYLLGTLPISTLSTTTRVRHAGKEVPLRDYFGVRHHHRVARPSVTIAISTSWRHFERSCARIRALLRPRLWAEGRARLYGAMSRPPSDRALQHLWLPRSRCYSNTWQSSSYSGCSVLSSTTRSADTNPCFGCQQGRLLLVCAGRCVRLSTAQACSPSSTLPLDSCSQPGAPNASPRFSATFIGCGSLNGFNSVSAFWYSDVSMDQRHHISLRAFVRQPMWKVVHHLCASTTMTLVVPSSN